MQFAGESDSKFNAFRLEQLEVRDDLNGKSFADIEADLLQNATISAYTNQSIRAVVIRNWPSVLFLHMVFLRLNTGSVTLSSQELRQALFPGPFSDFIDDTATLSEPLRKLLDLDEPDFRMRDVELLARYLAFVNYLPEYAGELKEFVDRACENLNAAWPAKSNDIKEQSKTFNLALEAGIAIFGLGDFARRPPGHGKRRLFNRAILDTMLFYFSDARIRELAQTEPAAVKSAFATLYASSVEFVRASESSTKTVAATATRYRLWGEALRSALGASFAVPELSNGRIHFDDFWP